MTEIDVGFGFIAVPYDSVTLNGIYMRGLNGELDPSKFAVVAPNGKVLMGEDGKRPYCYTSIEDCRRDAQKLSEYDEFMTH